MISQQQNIIRPFSAKLEVGMAKAEFERIEFDDGELMTLLRVFLDYLKQDAS